MATNGLQLRRGMPFAEWTDLGRRLAHVADGSAWALGDWIVYGQKAYGHRYKLALEATNLDYKTLRNYAWVARSVPPRRRRAGLSFQHHAQVAALPEPTQDLWLHRCATLHWSRAELRRRLARERDGADGAGREVMVRVRITPERERRWREAAAVAQCELPELLTRAADRAADTLLRPQEPAVPGAAPSLAAA